MASSTNIKIKKELTTKEKRIILITVLYNAVMEGEKRGKTNRRCVRTYSGMCERGILRERFFGGFPAVDRSKGRYNDRFDLFQIWRERRTFW